MLQLKLGPSCASTAVVVVLGILLALTPLSSKAINLAWLILFSLSAVWWSIALLGSPINTFPVLAFRRALLVLPAFFAAGLVLKILMQLYWSEAVHDVSFELTALVASLISLFLAGRWQSRCVHATTLGMALAAASLLAVVQGYGYMFGGRAGPTNAVNWGAGIALLMCLSMALTVDRSRSPAARAAAFLSVIVFSLALLVGGRRGAFFAILWCIGVACVLAVQIMLSNRWATWQRWMLAMLLSVGVGVTWLASQQLSAPFDRVRVGASEVTAVLQAQSGDSASKRGSVWSRIHMYRLGIEAASASPWEGVGVQGRSQVVKEAERVLNEPLFHLHNEYIQSWVAYGVLGLLSALCFPVGLLSAAVLMRHVSLPWAVCLGGLGVVHFFSGLSNVNSFHNYYGTLFAVVIVMPSIMFSSHR